MTEVLTFAGVPRATWYAKVNSSSAPLAPMSGMKRGRPIPGYTENRDGTLVPDQTIVAWLKEYRERVEFHNGGGVAKLRHYLRRDHGAYINRKKIYRLCRENELLLKRRSLAGSKRVRRMSRNHVVTGPNELWEFDVKYGYVHGESRFFFILAFVDVFTRKCVGVHVGLSCRQGDLCFVLKQALDHEGVKPESELIIRSDNGPQMRSNEFHNYLERLEFQLSHEFIPVQTPNKNAHVESFFSILEAEFIQVRYFSTFAEAYTETHAWVRFYNEERIHGSIGMRTPSEIVASWRNGESLEVSAVKL